MSGTENARTVNGPCYRAPMDANGMPLPSERARTIDEAVEDCYRGYAASAQKRGRNPRYPYVPMVMRPKLHIGRPDLFTQEQVRGKAFATREEAIAYSAKVIAFWRDHFRVQLETPNMRPIRAQWGVSDAAAKATQL